jgi:hypothetical protein
MENAVEAMKMGFAMIVFVIALTASMYLLNTASTTSKILLYYADETNYLDNIEVNSDVTKRTVNVETIIPTLYRYYKENFAVQIYNKDGKLVQMFDVNIEGKVRKAAGTISSNRTGEQNALMSLYGVTLTGTDADKTNPYLFEAPWIGNTSKDIKTRIDLYVNGKCAYINGTKVDYTKNNLGNFEESKFEEQFIEYAYKGDTISSEDGTETITGNSKPENKIVIIYREID